jgi:hypothetical protein
MQSYFATGRSVDDSAFLFAGMPVGNAGETRGSPLFDPIEDFTASG